MQALTVSDKRCCGCRDDVNGAAFVDDAGSLWCAACAASGGPDAGDDGTFALPPRTEPAPLATAMADVVEAWTFATAVGADPAYRVGRALTMDGWSADDARAALTGLAGGADADDADDARALALIVRALDCIPADPHVYN